MEAIVSQLSSNLSKAMTVTTRSGLQAMTPVAEKLPTMWITSVMWEANLAGYTPALLGTGGTGSLGSQRSATKVDPADCSDYLRTAITALMSGIAAKTPAVTAATVIPAKSLQAWSTFIATYARAIFEQPCLRAGVGATTQTISPSIASSLRYLADALASVFLSDNVDQNVTEYNVRGRALAEQLGLPVFTDLTAQEITSLVTRDPLREPAAYYAMIIYMAGKAINTSTADAVRVRRPRNLYDKFNRGVVWSTVGGTLTMSEGAYTMIAQVWVMNPTMRVSFLTPLIGLGEGEAQVTGNIVFTMFKLLQFAGMAHVEIIQSFLTRYQYAYKLKEIQGELRTLNDHCSALLRVPEHIRPYYKMLYADGVKLFDSKKFKMLTGLATEILAEKESSLRNYVHTTDDDLVARFKALRAIEEPEPADETVVPETEDED